MKKSFPILMVGIVSAMLFSCEKDIYDGNPTMEAYYQESMDLSTVSIDSVKLFKNKVNKYVLVFPYAKKDWRYKKINENIKMATIKITINFNVEWDSEKIIEF